MQLLIFLLIGASVFLRESVGGPLQPQRTNTFNFPFVDAVFDPARARIYAINAASNQVVSIRLNDGVADRSFTFTRAPETLAVRPDGRFLYAAMPAQQHSSYWFDGRYGFVGEVNLETSVKTQEWQIDVDPYDILATDSGLIIVPDGSGQWTDVAIYRAGSGTRAGRGFIRQASHVALHPSQTRFYSADTDLGPSDIMSWRFDNVTGAISVGFDSPYHGDYPMSGNVYTHPNGTNLLTAGGALYTSSEVQAEDMRYIRTLSGGPVSAVYFDTVHNATFTFGNTANSWETARPRFIYYGATFESVGQWDFTDPVSYIAADTNSLYLVSVRPDKTVLTVYANPAAGAETNGAPAASFSYSPNAPTTLTTISLDASASTDDGGATNLVYRWDFEADGAWDVPYTNTPTAQVRYNIGGTKTVRLEVMDRYGVTSRLEKTVNVPFEADPGTPGATNISFTIPFTPADAVADMKRFHLFATDTAGKRMVVLNLTNGFIEREFSFQNMPESMGITPNGSNLYVAQITRPHSPYWFSAQTGYVAQFDLATLTKIREIRIEADPAAIVATDNGLIGITGGSDQWTEVEVINGLTGQRLSGAQEYMSARLALHPSQNALYTGDIGLSPADHARFSFDPTTGANLGYWDSPYHGDYNIYGQPFPTPDGRYIISQGGVVLTSSPLQAFDLRFVQNLEGGMFTWLAFDTTNQAIFTVGGSWNSASTFRYYNANFELVRSEPLTNEVTRIFASAEKLWLIGKQGSNTVVFVRPNPAQGALTNAAPVANFSINPPAPTTLDYIQFDGGLSTDEEKSTLQYRWDWQADGTFDTTFTNNARATFRYISPGPHTVRLQVKDKFGVLAQVDRAFTVTAGFDPGAALAQTNAPFQLPFVVSDAAFDPLQPRLFALDNVSNRLVVVNLDTGIAEREFKFDFKPEALAITPNGLKMYVALITGPHTYYSGGTPHRGLVAEFTLDTLGKTREFELPIDPIDILATDSGKLIISDGSDQWTQVAVFDAATAQKLGSSSVYMGLRLALHPNQTSFYGGETGLSPSDFIHFDLSSTGSIPNSYDSIYHGDYPLGGKPFIFPDASGIFGPSGVVLSLSPSQSFDLRYLRTMPINGISDAAFDSTRKVMAAAAGGSKLVFYDYQNNNVIVERQVPGASFVGMRNGRAAVLANGTSTSKISFFRIPAQTVQEDLPPTITLSSPTNGAVVAVGTPVAVNYSAVDEDGDVTGVNILVGDTVTPVITNSIVFNSAGVFDVKAVATDNFNLSGTSLVAHVTATLPPNVAITEPAADSVLILPFTVRIAVNATDADGSIARVRLYDNGQLIKTFTGAPFTYDLPATTPAVHNVYAEATDNLGITSVSATVRFVVGGYGTDNLTPDIIVLGGASQTVYDNTVRATRQKYEPNHGGNGGGRSLWWAWKAPANGVAIISTAGSDFDTLLGVYTWTSTASLQSLVAVASNDDDPSGPPVSRVKFNATQNTTYYIAIDGRDGFAGNVLLTISQFASDAIVPNDKFANALPLLVNSTNTARNVGATRESFEPAHAGNTGGASVWWIIRPTEYGAVEISTEGSDFDTLLAVYSGGPSVFNLLPVVSNDDASASQISSKVILSVTPYSAYAVAVDGFNGASGNIRLTARYISASPTPIPANDNFTNAIVIARPAYVTNTSSLNATAEANEPFHAGQGGGHSLWWSWTPTMNGPVYISTRASSIDTVLAVYTGTSLSNLTQIAANDDDPVGLRTSAVYFDAVAGIRYRIAVDGYNGAAGNIVLALNQAVIEPPRISMQMQNSNLLISAEGATGQIVVEQSFDLLSWDVVKTVEPDEILSIPTQVAAESPASAFFRVKLLP